MKKIILIIILILSGLGFLVYSQGWFFLSPQEILSASLENTLKEKTMHLSMELKSDFVSDKEEGSSLLKLESDIDKNSSEELRTFSSFDFSVSIEGTTYSLEGILTSIGYEDLYLKIDTIPQIPLLSLFLDTSKIKGEWIKFSNKYVEEELEEEKAERIVKIFKENNPLGIKEELPGEKIDGMATYHYLLSLNREKMKTIFLEINSELESETDIQENMESIERFLDEMEDLEIEVWIDKREKLLRRIKTEKEFEINPKQGTAEDQLELGIKEGIVILSYDIRLSDFGKELNIEAPSEFKTMEEIMEEMYYSPYGGMNPSY
jgi:ABC-type multidrug transport system fused ATPase/permease subunit